MSTASRKKSAARSRAYARAHPEKIIARARAYREANREKIAAYNRAYREAHRGERAASSRAYHETHHDERAAYNRDYRKAHPEVGSANCAKRRALKAASPRIEKIDRGYVYERDGGKCHICRKKVPRAKFHLDHLVPLSRGGPHTHDNLAVAHAKCNRSRHAGRLPAQLRLVG